MIDLSISVVAYKNYDDIIKAIDTLEMYTSETINKKIYIIDNGRKLVSNDEFEKLKNNVHCYSDVQYIDDFVEDPTILYRQHGDNSVGAKKFGKKYFLERLKNINDIKYRLSEIRSQAAYFSKLYNLPKTDIIYQYGLIAKSNKFIRINFYRKNKIKKSGMIRNIGFYFFG